MLPAAKVLLVTVLLGGGAVGTYALAGGNGNAETTQASAPETTKPAMTAQEVAPTAPVETDLPTAGVTRNGGDSAVDGGVQQRAASGDNGQVQQPSSPVNNQADSQLSAMEGTAEGKQTIPETNDATKGADSEGTPGASTTVQQAGPVDNSGDDGRSDVTSDPLPSSGSNQGNLGDGNIAENTRQTGTSPSSNPVDTAGGAKGPGTDGTDTITTTREEETRTASGGEEANTVSSNSAS